MFSVSAKFCFKFGYPSLGWVWSWLSCMEPELQPHPTPLGLIWLLLEIQALLHNISPMFSGENPCRHISKSCGNQQSGEDCFLNHLFMNCFLTFYKPKGRSIKTKYFCSTVHILLATSTSWNLKYSNARRESSQFLYPCKTCSQIVIVERWH